MLILELLYQFQKCPFRMLTTKNQGMAKGIRVQAWRDDSRAETKCALLLEAGIADKCFLKRDKFPGL